MGLGGGWILVSFLALQLQEQEQRRDFMGMVIQDLMLERVSPAPSAGSEIAAGRISWSTGKIQGAEDAAGLWSS